MRRWLRVGTVLLAAVGSVVGCGWSQSPDTGVPAGPATGPETVATVSLQPYGWMTRRELSTESTITEEGEHKGWIQSGPPGGVAWRGVGEVVVDGSGRVYVGLPIWATRAAPKSKLRGEGDKLRVVVVKSAEGGNVERTMDFPTVSLDRIDLRLVGDDALTVFAGDKLMRVGADGKATAQLAIPNEEKEYEVWDLTSSSTGKTIRVRLNSRSRLLVDAQSLKVLKRCRDSADIKFDYNDEGTLTDDMEMMAELEGTYPSTTNTLEREVFCEKREPLAQFGAISFSPTILDDERFLARAKNTISLRKMDGETVWTTKAPAGQTFGEAQVSRDGSRVAMRLLQPQVYSVPQGLEGRRARPVLRRAQFGRNLPLTRTEDVEAGIEVLNIATGRLVGRVSIQEPDPDLQYKAKASFALSPDGRLLAVLQDGVLVVTRIP